MGVRWCSRVFTATTTLESECGGSVCAVGTAAGIVPGQ
jgi:hypothetical protein